MPPAKSRILYAEEHDDTSSALRLLLERSNYEARTAKTVTDGLSLAQSEHFDLYLLSGRFADGTGIEMCRHIRQFDSHTPILFYSAYTSEADRQRGLSAGAQAYLIKPGDIYDLIATITSLINQSKHKRQAHAARS